MNETNPHLLCGLFLLLVLNSFANADVITFPSTSMQTNQTGSANFWHAVDASVNCNFVNYTAIFSAMENTLSTTLNFFNFDTSALSTYTQVTALNITMIYRINSVMLWANPSVSYLDACSNTSSPARTDLSDGSNWKSELIYNLPALNAQRFKSGLLVSLSVVRSSYPAGNTSLDWSLVCLQVSVSANTMLPTDTCAFPSPTTTPSASRTPTPNFTPSISSTPSPSRTPSLSSSPSPTASATPTKTPSVSVSSSPGSSVTPTPITSVTPTSSPSVIRVQPSSSPNNHSTTSASSKKGLIIGVVVAAIVACGILGAIAFFIIASRKKKSRQDEAAPPTRQQSDKHATIGLEQELYIEDIKLKGLLGKGKFGEVYEGLWHGTTAVACKKLKSEDKQEFENEIRLLKKLNHPNVVRCLGIYNHQPTGEIFMVLELLRLGSLTNFLRNPENHKKLQTSDLVEMCVHAASGMVFLEQKNIVHRDLGARNLLVTETDGRYVVKISDFGLSRQVEDNESVYSSKEGVFPVKWSPPEVINFRQFTSKSDVWSFGITMWEIFEFGKVPYPNLSNDEAVQRVLQGYRLPKPSSCPDEVFQLMQQCWSSKPEARPNFKSVHEQLLQVLKLLKGEDEEMKFQPEVADKNYNSLYNNKNTSNNTYNNNYNAYNNNPNTYNNA